MREKAEDSACAHTPLRPLPTLAVGWRCARAPWQPDPPGGLQAALAALLACSAGRRSHPRGSLQDGGAEEEPAAECEEPTRSPGWGLGAQGGALSGAGADPSPPLGRLLLPGEVWPSTSPLPGRPPSLPWPGARAAARRPRVRAAARSSRGLGFAVQRPRASRARRGWGASSSRKGTWRAAAEIARVVSSPPAPSGRGVVTVTAAAAASVPLIISQVFCQLFYVVSLIYKPPREVGTTVIPVGRVRKLRHRGAVICPRPHSS